MLHSRDVDRPERGARCPRKRNIISVIATAEDDTQIDDCTTFSEHLRHFVYISYVFIRTPRPVPHATLTEPICTCVAACRLYSLCELLDVLPARPGVPNKTEKHEGIQAHQSP